MVLKCLYLARVGRPDISWSVNKLARAVTKWTPACDRRLARLISYTHHTDDYRQCCHVGNTAQHCILGLFQDSDFAGDLEDSKSISGDVLRIFGSRTFVPSVGCARNKRQYATVLQSLKSSRSMLDCEWVDYLLSTSGMWQLKCCVRQTTLKKIDQLQETGVGQEIIQAIKPRPQHQLAKSLDTETMRGATELHIFEDNEAVIKMIIKGKKSHHETCFQDPQSCP